MPASGTARLPRSAGRQDETNTEDRKVDSHRVGRSVLDWRGGNRRHDCIWDRCGESNQDRQGIIAGRQIRAELVQPWGTSGLKRLSAVTSLHGHSPATILMRTRSRSQTLLSKNSRQTPTNSEAGGIAALTSCPKFLMTPFPLLGVGCMRSIGSRPRPSCDPARLYLPVEHILPRRQTIGSRDHFRQAKG